MSLFHIQFPKRRGSLTWDELGCLARALGFRVDLFKSHLTNEIIVEDDGMSIQEVLKMMDYKLLYPPLHQTVNMHTAEWNMAVIRKCLYLLDHRALTFEDLHDIRMAYQVYEAIDMKGMVEEQHTLLRTLRMCGRTIAPMKLMHRIKHMKANFEEKGRIQLSEFLDLVLWCDVYQSFNPKDMEYAQGKEDELFKLVDFHRLLCHYDDRVMSLLDVNYLKEECGFEHETFGTKQVPKEPPVRNQGRIMQARLDKRRYRHLKHEVMASQKRVYRAHAGSIRPRPITMPELDSYTKKVERSNTSCTTAEQAYNTFRKRIRSVASRGSSVLQSETFERPQIIEYVRVPTPRAVSCKDKTEIEKKMESLKFAMTTLESRYLIKKEEEMDAYIPHYKQKMVDRQSSTVTTDRKPEAKKEIHWTQDAAEVFTRPQLKDPSPTPHDRKCDARFRGWLPVMNYKGPHFILVSPFYENSERGIFLQKLYDKSRSQAQHVKDFDFLYRYTHKSQIETNKCKPKIRPITAPATLHGSANYSDVFYDNYNKLHSPLESRRATSGLGKSSSLKQDNNLIKNLDLSKNTNIVNVPRCESPMLSRAKSPRNALSAFSKGSSVRSKETNKSRQIISAAGERQHSQKSIDSSEQKDVDTKSNSGYSEFEENLEPYDTGLEDRRSSGAVKTSVGNDSLHQDEVITPVPSMRHSKPEIVEIGQTGKIYLLENISESQDLEAKYSQHPSEDKCHTISPNSKAKCCEYSPRSQSAKKSVSKIALDNAEYDSDSSLKEKEPRSKHSPEECKKLSNEKICTPPTSSSQSEMTAEDSVSRLVSVGDSNHVLNSVDNMSSLNSSLNSPDSESHYSQNRFNTECLKQVHIKEPVVSDFNNHSTHLHLVNAALLQRNMSRNKKSEAKYWRLVERMNKLISNDLKVRLLTISK